MLSRRTLLAASLVALSLVGCVAHPGGGVGAAGGQGRLILVGGGLEGSNADVFRTLLTPAGPQVGPPAILIATAASGDEPGAVESMTARLRRYAPEVKVEAIGRTTPAEQAVAAIDRATTVFFTGGDQKRITDLYRPAGVDGPEARALRRLLARRGTIAGTSAGDAMMSDPMFLTGGSAAALGLARPANAKPDADGNDPAPTPATLGPQIGTGMGLLPKGWAIADSHFAQRNRVGRLVAALEVSGVRYGLGVSENAAIEIDLASGVAVGLTEATTVIVDAGRAGGVKRGGPTGLDRTNIAMAVLRRGDRIELVADVDRPPAPVPPAPAAVRTLTVPAAAQGEDRLSGFEVLLDAMPRTLTSLAPATMADEVVLDGHRLVAWPLTARGAPGPRDLLWLGLEIRVDPR